RALDADAARSRIHDRVLRRDDVGRPARVRDVDITELDASRVEDPARVRVHVVPGNGHAVDVPIHLDPIDPFEVRIELDVVRLDEDGGGEVAAPTAARVRLVI